MYFIDSLRPIADGGQVPARIRGVRYYLEQLGPDFISELDDVQGQGAKRCQYHPAQVALYRGPAELCQCHQRGLGPVQSGDFGEYPMALGHEKERPAPGTQVEYWWTAEDAAGKSAETSRATVSFDDNRYKWQSITTDPVTLLWYNGNRAFANALMTAAQQGLQRIEQRYRRHTARARPHLYLCQRPGPAGRQLFPSSGKVA